MGCTEGGMAVDRIIMYLKNKVLVIHSTEWGSCNITKWLNNKHFLSESFIAFKKYVILKCLWTHEKLQNKSHVLFTQVPPTGHSKYILKGWGGGEGYGMVYMVASYLCKNKSKYIKLLALYISGE